MSVCQPDARAWDAFVRAQPRAHVLQLSAWGKLKTAFGWKAEIAAVCDNDRVIAGAQLLFRRLPFRLGTMAYLPMGFYAPPDCETALWSAVDACARRLPQVGAGIHRKIARGDRSNRLSTQPADDPAAAHHPDRPGRRRNHAGAHESGDAAQNPPEPEERDRL
jgi:hypothetical protein